MRKRFIFVLISRRFCIAIYFLPLYHRKSILFQKGVKGYWMDAPPTEALGVQTSRKLYPPEAENYSILLRLDAFALHMAPVKKISRGKNNGFRNLGIEYQ